MAWATGTGSTPGPWHAERVSFYSRDIKTEDGGWVAQCWDKDAPLIVAAPELLEVLKEMLAVPLVEVGNGLLAEYQGERFIEISAIRKRAREIITRASEDVE